jgi:hypothetical protein
MNQNNVEVKDSWAKWEESLVFNFYVILKGRLFIHLSSSVIISLSLILFQYLSILLLRNAGNPFCIDLLSIAYIVILDMISSS